MSMVIILPDGDTFAGFQAALDGQQVQAIIEALKYRQVAVTMPAFEFDSRFSLNQALAEMGMPVAFSARADFSGMTGSKDLFVSDVLHKAFVSVDEEGTEAAAATAVVMKLSAMPEEPIAVTVDHPFLFLIRDNETGAILFVGRVLDPSAEYRHLRACRKA
jgi:serpin B